MRNKRNGIVALALLLIVVLPACSTFFQPMRSGKAIVGYKSQVYEDLVSLPPPEQPVVVVVYKFRDQTGQYKSSDTVLQYSTAVTQGATSMLIKALQDAGGGKWFTVLEREGLNNLLNERKIIRQTRKRYSQKKDGEKDGTPPPSLPPLLYAPIMLEGGVIAYETNLLTGGLGARYFGAGGSTEFRRDTVSIFLRAVSVKRGKILHTVHTSKTIFSASLDGTFFRFVELNRLLEAEVGLTTNEPPQMAVMEAIEKGVYSMIMEGITSNLWTFADASLIKPHLDRYLEEKDEELVAEFNPEGQIVGLKRRKDLEKEKEPETTAQRQAQQKPQTVAKKVTTGSQGQYLRKVSRRAKITQPASNPAPRKYHAIKQVSQSVRNP